jgi:hypothetical protein
VKIVRWEIRYRVLGGRYTALSRGGSTSDDVRCAREATVAFSENRTRNRGRVEETAVYGVSLSANRTKSWIVRDEMRGDGRAERFESERRKE